MSGPVKLPPPSLSFNDLQEPELKVKVTQAKQIAAQDISEVSRNVVADPEGSMYGQASEREIVDVQRGVALVTTGYLAGDYVRVTRFEDDQSLGPASFIQVPGKDETPPVVPQAALSVGFEGGFATIRVADVNLLPLEPNLELLVRNTRTGEVVHARTNAQGDLTEPVQLKARGGDVLRVVGKDGAHSSPPLKVHVPLRAFHDLPDPSPLADELRSRTAFSGPLFRGEPKPSDVILGYAGVCYAAGSAASIAATRPDLLKEAIQELPNGNFRIRLFKKTLFGVEKVEKEVDPQLYLQERGLAAYGNGTLDEKSRAPDKMVLWWPVLEKAFAELRGGSYGKAEHGFASEAITAFTGLPSHELSTRFHTDAGLWKAMKETLDQRLPVAFGTFDEVEKLTGAHTYSVLKVAEENGKRMMWIRNPYGQLDEEEQSLGEYQGEGVVKVEFATIRPWLETITVTG